MEKAKEFIRTNKKIMMIAAGVIVALVAFIVGFMFLSGNSKEKELREMLEEMGRDFYENYYYDGLNKEDDEKTAFLQGYEKIGIKINLNNLSRFNSKVNAEKVKEFVNPKTDEPCDGEQTKVKIYPTANYKRKDYKIEVELVCGFDSENKKEEN